MHTALPRYRRPRNPRLRRALLVAGLGLVACVAFEGAGSGRALALTESIREVPPIVGFMSGQVELSSDGGTTWATPPSESRVPRLSLIRTGSDGSCILVFEDNSLVAMRPGTTIQILPQAQELRLAVLSGEAWVRFDYVARNQRDGIGLPHATVSALEAGSFSFGASQDASVVKVLEGLVKVLPGGGDARVPVTAGQTFTVGSSGVQYPVAFDVGLERTQWQSLLEQAGLSVTTTTLAGTTTTRPLPPDGPVGLPTGAIVMLLALGWGALAILAVLGILIYLGVNRRSRRRRYGR
jgi:uncharacterized protein YaiE (UPF0345 family)